MQDSLNNATWMKCWARQVWLLRCSIYTELPSVWEPSQGPQPLLWYRVSLKKRSLRDWHPKKWFQGQPVKMCRCKSFLLVVSKAVSCSCPLGRTKISKSFRNSILTWYMLYLYEWRAKMQKKRFLGRFQKCPFSGARKWYFECPNPKTETTFSRQHPPTMVE